MSGSSDEMDVVAVLERWTDSGALWRVVAHSGDAIELSLLTCSGGEEVDRIWSNAPAVLAYVGDRWASDD